jgi:replication initiation protein RepC
LGQTSFWRPEFFCLIEGERDEPRIGNDALWAPNDVACPCGGAGECPECQRREKTVHKWKVVQALTEAKDKLGIPDRAIAVLNALLSFHQETTMTAGDALVVFPSNAKLIARAHGVAPTTLKRHLAILVDAGIVIRRDSPNGKRYARRGEGGEIAEAYGFDLTPLVARAEEFEQLAAEVRGREARRCGWPASA